MIRTVPEINLMLGTSCNWHCDYCLQGKEVGFDRKEDLDSFISNFKSYLNKNGINKVERIQYWGGEPLLRIDTIKYLYEAFKEIPRITEDRIVTNGSLVDDDFVDFVNNNNIYINVSYHDGQLSDHQWNKILRIKKLTITALFHHNRLRLDDLYAKWLDLANKFGRRTNWCISWIYGTPDVPKDKYWFTKEDIDYWVNYMKEEVVPLSYTSIFYKHYLEVLMLLLTEHYDIPDASNFCYNSQTISIDLRGNLYFCHHDASHENIVGNAFNRIPILKEVEAMKDSCKSCEYLRYCHGGCIRNLDKSVECYLIKSLVDFAKWLIKTHPDSIGPRYHLL